MANYEPYQTDGVNIRNLIHDLGNNPQENGQQPIQHNIIKALYNFLRVFNDIGGPPNIFKVSSNYTATDNDLIVIENLTSDIEITLPASGSIYIKRMDDSNYTVTIKGTVDGVSDILIDYRDGVHLVGANNEFYFV